VTPLQSR